MDLQHVKENLIYALALFWPLKSLDNSNYSKFQGTLLGGGEGGVILIEFGQEISSVTVI